MHYNHVLKSYITLLFYSRFRKKRIKQSNTAALYQVCKNTQSLAHNVSSWFSALPSEYYSRRRRIAFTHISQALLQRSLIKQKKRVTRNDFVVRLLLNINVAVRHTAVVNMMEPTLHSLHVIAWQSPATYNVSNPDSRVSEFFSCSHSRRGAIWRQTRELCHEFDSQPGQALLRGTDFTTFNCFCFVFLRLDSRHCFVVRSV